MAEDCGCLGGFTLDAVIAVETGLAHLAGLMGVLTIIILPRASDWRWLCVAREDKWFDRSFWYHSLILARRGEQGWGEDERFATV